MSRRRPNVPQRSTAARESAPMSEFSWLRCRAHPWLQRSVLVGRGFSPLCFPYDGPAHPVDAAELEGAA